MSHLIEINEDVIHMYDETPGLQNAVASPAPDEDANDNDIALAKVPSVFSDRLSKSLGEGGLEAGVPTGAALSGYDGSTPEPPSDPDDIGLDIFTINAAVGGVITDIRFTDSNGDPLEGLDSGVSTLDGNHIFLYTDVTNNNIVLAREGNGAVAEVGGDIVFAAFIEETETGGKLWSLHYQTIQHSSSTDPDEDENVDLTGLLFAEAQQDLTFSLANAPAGQNLFLMFTTENPETEDVGGVIRITDPAIIATGKNPANQSEGENITTGDTINSSHAGGPTTFGSNNQMIVEGEGIRFSYVTGAKQDVTIPNLSQGEADVEANIDFTGVFATKSASFDVVQLQGGKSAVVKISAFSSDADSETGVHFIDGYTNDTIIDITNVRVFDNDTGLVIENSDGSANDPNIVITISSGVATIEGIEANHKLEYTTTEDHDRSLVENVGPGKGKASAAFDIGGFKLLNVSSDRADIGAQIFLEDDGPSIDPNLESVPTLTTDDTLIPDSDGPESFAGLFDSDFGADGFWDDDHNDIEDDDAITYELGVSAAGVDSGLYDTLSGDKILLRVDDVTGNVEGYLQSTPTTLAFEISVNANTGEVSLNQVRAIVHDDPTDPDETGTAAEGMAVHLVTLTATITDGDGDFDTALRNIGDAFKFEDDGPSITVGPQGTLGTLVVDETDLLTDASADFADNFSNTPLYGADGPAVVDPTTTSYALSVSAPGADSGLDDTATGQDVLLTVNAGVVQGRTATSDELVFSVTVDDVSEPGKVMVTLDQERAVIHTPDAGPNQSTTLSTDLIALTRTDTITDKDGDTNTGSAFIDIGQVMSFKDDGPSLDFGNLVGTGTILPQYGEWYPFVGADQPGDLDLSLVQFRLVRPDSTEIPLLSFTFEELAGSPNPSGDYLFAGSLTADFDNNASTDVTTDNFTLTVFANGLDSYYEFDLEDGFNSTISFSSADGQLQPGGPDPVQTLGFDDTSIVFFALNPLALAADIIPAIAPNFTELDLQRESAMADYDEISGNGDQPGLNNFSFISDNFLMNVSNAGIGVSNNILQGDNIAGSVPTADDESFVINPEDLLTSVKVFIDNSVGGYNTATEDLYYTTYFVDGTHTAPTLVEAGDLTAEAKGQVSFEITNGIANTIDAVQLTMYKGAIKIPEIKFTKGVEDLASDVLLDFTALLTDADGDTATSNFSVDLFANELNGVDYELEARTSSDLDAFNIDLSEEGAVINYHIDNFNTSDDKLVLLGDPDITLLDDVDIDNDGPDSIVSVTESGGESTIITVVGVDLDASHIVLVG